MIKKILLCILLTSIPIAAYSKRMAPPKVQPVVYGGVRYEAPTVPMGSILAYDSKTGKLLWEKKLYDAEYNKKLEKDIQDIFIEQLKLEKGDADMFLTATDERGRSYKVDLRGPQPDFYYKEVSPEVEVWNPNINCGIPSSDFMVIFENGFKNEEVSLLVDNMPVFSQVITSAKNNRASEDLKLKKESDIVNLTFVFPKRKIKWNCLINLTKGSNIGVSQSEGQLLIKQRNFIPGYE